MFFFFMNKYQKLIGKLLLTLKLMQIFQLNNDVENLHKIQQCFSSDYKSIRKAHTLDLILKQHIELLK